MALNVRVIHLADPAQLRLLERVAKALENLASGIGGSDDVDQVLDLSDKLRRANDELAARVAAHKTTEG